MQAECGQGDHPQLSDYSHQNEMARVEDIGKTLNDLHEELTKRSVRCHLLQLDMATQFSPHMVQKLTKAQESCHNCANNIAARTESPPSCTSTNIASQEAGPISG